MKREALGALLVLVCGAACASATGPTRAERGDSFTLAPGETALVEPDALLMGFVAVSADSRCPIDVDCVTAGDAAVEIWLRRPPAARETRVLHTDPGAGDRVEYDGSQVRLLELRPTARSDAPVAADDYRATFVVR